MTYFLREPKRSNKVSACSRTLKDNGFFKVNCSKAPILANLAPLNIGESIEAQTVFILRDFR